MQKLVSGSEMATYDKYTINELGIPSLVLMERAALCCVQKINAIFDKASKICCVCGPGNNGADGVAIARILKCQNYCNISLYIIGEKTKYTDELNKQLAICHNVDIPFLSDISELNNQDLIVDAIFGIGLSRDPKDNFAQAINAINSSKTKVLSVDVPSGICANTGKAYTPFICADYTVTFQFIKKGLLLGNGYVAKGELTVADIGIVAPASNNEPHSNNNCFMFEPSDIESLLPKLPVNANKGSRGKVLVIAGSENIYGACYLSAKAALMSGCGMVKVYTHKNNINVIQESLPEAMYSQYEDYSEQDLANLIDWADVVLIGPGLSTSEIASKMVKQVVTYATCPIVIDADGINVLSRNLELLSENSNYNITLTPHLKEMSRLCGISVNDIQNNMEDVARDFCQKFKCNIILKNHTSFIVSKNNSTINTTGNQSMATAGSGDILAGITASLLAQNCSPDNALPLASYIHGKAGEEASKEKGLRHVIATDLLQYIDF